MQKHPRRCKRWEWESAKVRKVLGDLLTEDMAKRNNVCVAGSAPLQLLLASYPEGSFPRTLEFVPHDIDVFVFGEDGETEEAFRAAVVSMVSELQNKGNEATDYNWRQNMYIADGVPAWIADAYVDAICQNLSFVQCPMDSTKEEVVARFDMDIVRVMYDIPKEEIVVDPAIKRNIEQGKATIRDRHFSFTALRKGDIRTVLSTLHRMTKYKERGFSFTNTPLLLCDQDDIMTTPTAETLLEWKPPIDLVRLNVTVRNVIEFMEYLIPKGDLESGKIGLCGELPLMKLMIDHRHVLSSRILFPWKIKKVNICICEELHQDYKERVKNIWMKLATTERYVLDLEESSSLDIQEAVHGLGMFTHTTTWKIKNIDVVVRFVHCEYADTCEDVVRANRIGIERVWYDFRNHAFQVCPGVREQLECGVVKVGDLGIEDDVPTIEEISIISSLLQRMQYYQSQGFVFEKFPIIVPKCFQV